jgi:predicted NAD/FAD-binding protein
VGEYFTSRGYSPAFVDFMARVAAIIGPQTDEEILETSVVVFATVLSSGFLSLIASSSHEMAFAGGVGAFVDRLAAPVRAYVRLGCGVSSITRDGDHVRVVDERGEAALYDQLVVCVDGLLALALLEDASALEQNLLSSCELKTYASILHTDANLLIPGIEEPRRSYLEISEGVMTGNLSVINLEKRELSSPLLLTYERLRLDGGPPPAPPPIDPAKILRRYEFRQTKDNIYAFEVKRNLFRIQGQRRTWYAGAWTTMSTLEHTVVSALVIAEALGAAYPFADDLEASRSFAAYKSMMLQGTQDFSLSVL